MSSLVASWLVVVSAILGNATKILSQGVPLEMNLERLSQLDFCESLSPMFYR